MPKKILIVDDEPSIIVALQFLMEQNGYQTLVAFSGEEAMETITCADTEPTAPAGNFPA